MVDKLYYHLLQMPLKKTLLNIFVCQAKKLSESFIIFGVIFKQLSGYLSFLRYGQIFDFSQLFQYGILPQPPRGLLYSNPKQIATDIIVRIAYPVKRKKMNIIDELDNFINQTKESKEIKRAQGVKMILLGKSYHEVK